MSRPAITPVLQILMNMSQARVEFNIPQFKYSQAYLAATQEYRNNLRNFETALERIETRGKINRRRRPQRSNASSEGSSEVSEET